MYTAENSVFVKVTDLEVYVLKWKVGDVVYGTTLYVNIYLIYLNALKRDSPNH